MEGQDHRWCFSNTGRFRDSILNGDEWKHSHHYHWYTLWNNNLLTINKEDNASLFHYRWWRSCLHSVCPVVATSMERKKPVHWLLWSDVIEQRALLIQCPWLSHKRLIKKTLYSVTDQLWNSACGDSLVATHSGKSTTTHSLMSCQLQKDNCHAIRSALYRSSFQLVAYWCRHLVMSLEGK